tara:strand:- start:6202 stop:6591 length:390 start_codon:yes stop_codon:yes gene_type:complete
MAYDPSRMAAVMQRMQARGGPAGMDRMAAMRNQMPGMSAMQRPAMPMQQMPMPQMPMQQMPPVAMRPAVMPQGNPMMRPGMPMQGMQAPAMPPGQMAAMGVAPAGNMRQVAPAPSQNMMLPNAPYRGRL